eukprot:CAMPEP_0119342426 /NCGR_PEP_ID=MMETSP1333-20130426/104693_1 /TAXON_ID=418940 /ORGANISM="Scyphosphaera apsteinii, Strain RCC1455" /LENGTH=118 /DNA_ID=CAMNT_0007354643 /DNA_START=38 /DNA_END=390 /DNA_ORIENTATION=+
MAEAGVQPTVFSYSSAILAHAKLGQAKEAERLFRRMRASGVSADTVALNAVIEAHGRAGNAHQAVAWLDRARAGEFGIELDCISYTIVISALGKQNMGQHALRLWKEIQARNISADIG